MEIVKITLIAVVAIGVIGFILSWAQAYRKVENIEKRSQQLAVLQPWWFLDSQLLPAEHEPINIIFSISIRYLIVNLTGQPINLVDWYSLSLPHAL